MIQGTDGVTQTVDHLLQGGKDFVAEATLPNFLPNLFYRIHFRCVRWNVKQNDIVRQLQTGGFMPCRTITAKQNNIISILLRNINFDVWRILPRPRATRFSNPSINPYEAAGENVGSKIKKCAYRLNAAGRKIL